MGNAVRSEKLEVRNGGAMHNSYSIASFYKWSEVLATWFPLWGNAIKLSKIGDDCCGFKVHRFEGSKVHGGFSWLILSIFYRNMLEP